MSVHAYALSPAGPILLLFALTISIYFFYLKSKSAKPLVKVSFDRSSVSSISALMGIIGLFGIFVVCLAGVVIPLVVAILTNVPFVLGSEFFNFVNLPFVLLLFIALLGQVFPENAGSKSFLLAILLIVFSFVLAIVDWPTGNWIANFGLPVAIGTFAALIFRLMRDISRQKRGIKVFGVSLIHLGLAVTLIGVFISGGATQSYVGVRGHPNSTISLSNMWFTFGDFVSFLSEGKVELDDGVYVEYVGLQINATVAQSAVTYPLSLDVRFFPSVGIVIEPTIVRTIGEDIYVHLEQTDELTYSLITAASGNFSAPEIFTLTVKTFPLINLVWGGCFLLGAGMATFVTNELIAYRHETRVWNRHSLNVDSSDLKKPS
jgi:cytochrome c biogenesis factor